jgi:lysophospholipid acyltransferase (LPLAT)-like uncharacterized protein
LKIKGWPARCLVAFGYHLLQLWMRTLRFQLDDRAGIVTKPLNERVIGALWHNRVLLLPHIAGLYAPQRRAVALISASRDGDILTDLVRRYDVEVARGSTSRKGASAMLQLADKIRDGFDVIITPDGPRGPVYEIGGGIIFLAQKSGAPVVLIHMEYSDCWRLNSWDRFILPKPFSSVRVIFGGLHEVAQTTTDAEFESERLRLQNAMLALLERR